MLSDYRCPLTVGNYRQHLTFAGCLAILYAWAAFGLARLHWLYGSVAALLTTLGGLLPDLDHPVGVELKGFTGVLGVLAAVAVWHNFAVRDPDLPFELHLWAAIGAFVMIRYGMRRILSRVMIHRGISHSFPTCAAYACAIYLYYPSPHHIIRLMMAAAVTLGFLSHLVLDEMFSVDLGGNTIKRSFGTAMKFWAPSIWSTLGIYALLSYLIYRVIQIWPEGSAAFRLGEPLDPPRIPVPDSWHWPESWRWPVPGGAIAARPSPRA